MLFLQGLGIGLAIAAPVGAIGILCIQRTLTQGRWIGFVSGMGAATADGLYGSIAAFGLITLVDGLVAQSRWLMLVGGLYLCYLGVTTVRQRPPEPAKAALTTPSAFRSSALTSYGSVLLLTLVNPSTVFSFLAIFSGLGLGPVERDAGGAAVLVLGVFVGSALWWLTLSTGVHYLSRWVGLGRLVWLNRVSGVVIGAFGVVALWRFGASF